MRPPISELAQKLLTDKVATRQLKDVLSGKSQSNRITYFDRDKHRSVVVEVTSR